MRLGPRSPAAPPEASQVAQSTAPDPSPDLADAQAAALPVAPVEAMEPVAVPEPQGLPVAGEPEPAALSRRSRTLLAARRRAAGIAVVMLAALRAARSPASTPGTPAPRPWWRRQRAEAGLAATLVLVCGVVLLMVHSNGDPSEARTTAAGRPPASSSIDPPSPGTDPGAASVSLTAGTPVSLTAVAGAVSGTVSGTTVSISGLPGGLSAETDDGPPTKAKPLPPAVIQGLTATATPGGLSLFSDAAGAAALGSFAYKPNPNGSIVEDPAWVKANITTETVPILGQETCNRLMFPQLIGALTELQSDGLSGLVNVPAAELKPPNCWEPRYVDSDPTAPISYHAWGIAIDINPTFNPEGSPSHQDPRLVSIFESWGFRWGGTWTRPDPMHFELQAVALPGHPGAVAASIGGLLPIPTLTATAAAAPSPHPTPSALAPAPPLTLAVTPSAAFVSLGAPVTATATLATGSALSGGTLTFMLYGPNDPTCQNAPAFVGAEMPAAAESFNFGPVTPEAGGGYQWVVSYSGDGANAPVASGCGDHPVTVNP